MNHIMKILYALCIAVALISFSNSSMASAKSNGSNGFSLSDVVDILVVTQSTIDQTKDSIDDIKRYGHYSSDEWKQLGIDRACRGVDLKQCKPTLRGTKSYRSNSNSDNTLRIK